MGRSIVQSFSYPQEELPTIKKLEEIADREKRSLSYIIVEASKEYAKAHGEGNDTYPLEEFEKGLVAYPTAWAIFDAKRLRSLPDEDILDITEKLLARTEQMNEEIRRRYPSLAGFREFKKMLKGEGVPTAKQRR